MRRALVPFALPFAMFIGSFSNLVLAALGLAAVPAAMWQRPPS